MILLEIETGQLWKICLLVKVLFLSSLGVLKNHRPFRFSIHVRQSSSTNAIRLWFTPVDVLPFTKSHTQNDHPNSYFLLSYQVADCFKHKTFSFVLTALFFFPWTLNGHLYSNQYGHNFKEQIYNSYNQRKTRTVP